MFKICDLSIEFGLTNRISAGSSLFGIAAIQRPLGWSVSRSFKE